MGPWSPRSNYCQLASDALTSTPVNLDGCNFSCRLLRHTGTHTLHSWSPRFHYRWSPWSPRSNYGQLASDAITSTPVNLDGWNFSCRLLRHTGTHTAHSHPTILHHIAPLCSTPHPKPPPRS